MAARFPSIPFRIKLPRERPGELREAQTKRPVGN
jgi:hypothetical protein